MRSSTTFMRKEKEYDLYIRAHIDPHFPGPRKEVFEAWLSPHASAGSLVTIDFKEKGPKETEVILHHVGLPSETSRNSHRGGWGAIL